MHHCFLLGLERPDDARGEVILKRAVRLLGRGVEFPDMPWSVSVLISMSTH